MAGKTPLFLFIVVKFKFYRRAEKFRHVSLWIFWQFFKEIFIGIVFLSGRERAKYAERFKPMYNYADIQIFSPEFSYVILHKINLKHFAILAISYITKQIIANQL